MLVPGKRWPGVTCVFRTGEIPMTQDLETTNLQLVQALFNATGKGDWAAAESMLTSDFSVTEAGTLPFAGTYHGRGALQELFTLVMSAAGVTGLDIEQLTAGGDRVVALLEMVLGGPPEVRVPLAETFRVRDGKVCEIRPYYFDPRPVAAAIEARKRAATTWPVDRRERSDPPPVVASPE